MVTSVHGPIASFRCAAEFNRYRGMADFSEPTPRQIYASTPWHAERQRGTRHRRDSTRALKNPRPNSLLIPGGEDRGTRASFAMPVDVNSRRYLVASAQQPRLIFDRDRLAERRLYDETFNPCQSGNGRFDLQALGANKCRRNHSIEDSTPFSNIQVPACRLRCWPFFPA